jgi:hypothetical protein
LSGHDGHARLATYVTAWAMNCRFSRRFDNSGKDGDKPVPRLTVRGEIVLAAKRVVVDSRDARRSGIKVRHARIIRALSGSKVSGGVVFLLGRVKEHFRPA